MARLDPQQSVQNVLERVAAALGRQVYLVRLTVLDDGDNVGMTVRTDDGKQATTLVSMRDGDAGLQAAADWLASQLQL